MYNCLRSAMPAAASCCRTTHCAHLRATLQLSIWRVLGWRHHDLVAVLDGFDDCQTLAAGLLWDTTHHATTVHRELAAVDRSCALPLRRKRAVARKRGLVATDVLEPLTS